MNNRTIKFRAWDKLRKEMLEVYEISFDSEQVAGYSPSEKKTRRLNPLDDDFDLMQFTGLLDRSGKEIYEGDIVFSRFMVTEGERVVIVHGWGKDNESYSVSYGWCMKYLFWSDTKEPRDGVQIIGGYGFSEETEIIGNIYENPDLLTNKQ